MAIDKKRDDKKFNCSEEHEFKYVSGLYSDKKGVYFFLKKKCKSNAIKNSTHLQVYELIKKELGYQIPV